MKREGYLLIYVILVLGFIAVLALYATERMQLAIQIEGHRIHTIREEKANETRLALLFKTDIESTSRTILSEHLTNSVPMNKTTYPVDLPIEGETLHANVTVDLANEEMLWQLADNAETTGSVLQRIETQWNDENDENATITSRIDRIRTCLDSDEARAYYEMIDHEGDVFVELSEDRKEWIISLFPPKAESPETDVTTEAEEREAATEEETEGTEPVGETEANTPVTEPPEETEPLTEPEIVTLKRDLPLAMYIEGDVNIRSSSQEILMDGILLVGGNLTLHNIRFSGFNLVEGDVSYTGISKTVGYLESANQDGIPVTNRSYSPVQIYRKGIPLQGFIQFVLETIIRPAPTQFPD